MSVQCLARRSKDRDEVKWVPQKWEKEVCGKHLAPLVHARRPNLDLA